ncbi:MAG: sugar phosphate isomerase/epimerase [Chloroflexi bacterium]|nr:sugar phosphate isomerase/epimerase [Chloroflexota bacterium]
MKLGVDIYTLRSQGWNAFEYLDYAARLGLDTVHFSDLEPFERIDKGYLREVRTHAERLGLSLEAGMGSICPTSTTFRAEQGSAVEQVERMLQVAHELGSPVLRCFLGTNADRHTKQPLSEHILATVDTCRAVRGLAKDLGIKLAIENHAGDLQGRELKALIEEAGPDYVGACIDSGNPLWVAEDPLVTLEHLAPYVVTSHVRDTCVWPHPQGAAVQWVAMGDGNVGIEAWAERFQELCPESSFTLEIITGSPPRVLPYLHPDYWSAYPDTPAAEFARFERLVREGQPFLGAMMVAPAGDIPPEYQAALRVQQRLDFERSVAYCKETLGIGEKT